MYLSFNCILGSHIRSCRWWKAGGKVYKNCFFGTAKTRTSTRTSTTTQSFSALTALGATNYWKFSNNNNFVDSLTGLSFVASSYSFVADRKGNPNSAIYFNYGFGLLPTATYFSGSLSVTGWVYMITNTGTDSRLMYCASSTSDDFVMVKYSSLQAGSPPKLFIIAKY